MNGRLRILVVTLSMVAPLAPVVAPAAVPGQISYQGYLTSSTGTPHTAPVTLQFRLFDAATGGTPLWTEDHALTPADGLVFAQLGSVTALPAASFSGVPLWLELAVNDTTLVPRQPLASVAYAFRSAVADSAALSALGAAVEGSEIADGTLTDADLAPAAAIAGTKVAPDFGAQEVRTTGDLRGATAHLTGLVMTSGAQAGWVLTADGTGQGTWQPPAASVGGSGTAGALARFVSPNTLGSSMMTEASGSIGVGTASPTALLHLLGAVPATPTALIQGAPGQTAALLELRDGNGALVASVSAAGGLTGGGSGLTNLNASNLTSGTLPGARLGGTYSNPLNLPNPNNTFAGSGGGLTNLVASNIATGTLNPQRLPIGGTWSLGSPLAISSVAGQALYVESASTRVGSGTTAPQAKLHVVPLNQGMKGLIVQQSVFGQTVNLQEWQHSSGAVLGSIGPTGVLSINGAGVTNVDAATLSGTLSTGQLPAGGSWSLASPLSLDGGTLHVDPAANRVGIGTTSPSKALTIAADLTDYDITTSGTSGFDITTQGGDGGAITISSREASSAGIIVATNNNVGIGVLSPTDKLQVNGTFSATGMKNAVVPTSRGMTRLYSEEASEVWFSDYGSGRLVAGRARIELDPLFLETVTVSPRDPLKVFVQVRGECHGVYVQSDARGFTVIELQSGASDVAFDYRAVAKRRGFEGERLATAPQP